MNKNKASYSRPLSEKRGSILISSEKLNFYDNNKMLNLVKPSLIKPSQTKYFRKKNKT